MVCKAKAKQPQSDLIISLRNNVDPIAMAVAIGFLFLV
jgi:hypothetical protein